MKGLTHFVSGIAVASFFPQAVHMAVQEKSFILALGGIFGILPDTLDFKFARYFFKPEFEVRPDPNNLDAKKIAEGVAEAVKKAAEDGKSTLQLHTMQLGANRWRSYSLSFEKETNEIVVEIGPEIDTGQLPFLGTEVKDPQKAVARVKVDCEFQQDFDKKSTIGIMTGPAFEFAKTEDGKVEIIFLPWHRTWSHSFTLGILTAFIAGIIAYFTVGEGPNPDLYTLPRWMMYPLIILFGSAIHIIEDSTGFMGNNLFYPFTKKRTKGLGFMSASDAVPNFFFVYTSILCIIFNLDRFHPGQILETRAISNPWFYWIVFWALPSVVMFYLYFKGQGTKSKKKNKPDFDSPKMEHEPDVSVI